MFSPRIRRTTGTFLATYTLLSAPVHAEDLIQVFTLARNHDASIQAANSQSLAASTRQAQARGALLPNLSLVRAATRDRYEPNGDSDTAGVTTETRTNRLGLNLRQSLFNAGLYTDVQLAKVAGQSAQLDYDIALQDFILQVAQAYFNVLSTTEVLETRRLSKQAIASQLDAAIRRFKAGLGVITDEEEAQARHDLAEADEIAAENDVRAARLALDRLTGQPGIQPKPIAGGSALSMISPGKIDDWLRATATHPTVIRAQLALERARLDTRRSRQAYLPTIDLVGSISKNRVGGTVSPLSSLPTGRSTTSSIGVEMNIPLFSGGTQYYRVAETVHLEDAARSSFDAVTRTAEETTERTYFDLQSALAKARALAAAEVSSQRSLDGTQRGYKAGLRLNLDVLNAQSQLYQTRSDLARTRYDVLMRSLRLKAAAGKLDAGSLDEINRLL
jgi:outer membrane protein